MFNHEKAMYLLWIENAKVLHVVDTHTMFQNAVFINGKSSKDLRESFLM